MNDQYPSLVTPFYLLIPFSNFTCSDFGLSWAKNPKSPKPEQVKLKKGKKSV
jgi:hypothetical protein